MSPETAAMAERLWPEFLRLMLLMAGGAWAVVLLLMMVAEAVRGREVAAALRELGVATRRRRPEASRRRLGRPVPRPAAGWARSAVRGRRFAGPEVIRRAR